jgi:hypothetical protein
MQHSIDLLPESIRARSEAGLRTGRYIAATISVVMLLVVTATHSRIALNQASEQLQRTREQANQVLSVESKAAELRRILDRTEDFIETYERIALPLDVSQVIATIASTLPETVTLDQIDIDAGARVIARTSRSKGEADTKAPAAPRILNGEISGFAASDLQITELVQRLSHMAPFKDVSLDFSRTRLVRERMAREFRVSFRIDLDAVYIDATGSQRQHAAAAGREGDDHVQ